MLSPCNKTQNPCLEVWEKQALPPLPWQVRSSQGGSFLSAFAPALPVQWQVNGNAVAKIALCEQQAKLNCLQSWRAWIWRDFQQASAKEVQKVNFLCGCLLSFSSPRCVFLQGMQSWLALKPETGMLVLVLHLAGLTEN